MFWTGLSQGHSCRSQQPAVASGTRGRGRLAVAGLCVRRPGLCSVGSAAEKECSSAEALDRCCGHILIPGSYAGLLCALFAISKCAGSALWTGDEVSPLVARACQCGQQGAGFRVVLSSPRASARAGHAAFLCCARTWKLKCK